MKKDKYNLSKEELRKHNRKKAQKQAYTLMAVVLVDWAFISSLTGMQNRSLLWKKIRSRL